MMAAKVSEVTKTVAQAFQNLALCRVLVDLSVPVSS
jgi:hypothetical protein